jgi:hypothetical protein
MREYSHLRKLCWGRNRWARRPFVANSGNVNGQVIIESIRAQDQEKAADFFRVDDTG